MINMNNVLELFKKIDAYPKTAESVKIKTYSGAAVTIISTSIIFVLILSEFHSYLSPDIREDLFVDVASGPKLQIHFDIIIHTISCDYLALDAMDNSGERHYQIVHNVYKRKLSLKGEPIEDPKKEDIQKPTDTPKESENKTTTPKCGSCYGAAEGCCNTCEEVKAAYREKHWIVDFSKIEQCKEDSQKLDNAFAEGCQIYGSLEVNRISGSFHIAPGQSMSANNIHVHNIHHGSHLFNTTHTIRHMSFGTKIAAGANSPLDNVTGLATEGGAMFQYYIKIVPTMYVKLDNSVIHTNQFSVTRHQKSLSSRLGESGIPGAFFRYELSPLMVKYTEQERSFGHFATSVCAIIGGVFTAAGILDIFLYHSVKVIEEKFRLGKLN